MKNIEPKKKVIKGFKETSEIKEKIEEINVWIEENGWKKIFPGDDFWKYEPISKYKNELGMGAIKSNQILEKMGLIIREDKSKGGQAIVVTERGKEFGRQMIEIIVIPKGQVYILKAKKYVVWAPEIVQEIKKYLAEGEEKNGDTKSKTGKNKKRNS